MTMTMIYIYTLIYIQFYAPSIQILICQSIVIRIVFFTTLFIRDADADADADAYSINEIILNITGSLAARSMKSTNRGRLRSLREKRIELPLLFSQHHEINGSAYTERIPPKI